MSDLGFMLSARPRRLSVSRYSVLTSQVRCSTGFTHAPLGALYVVPPKHLSASVRASQANPAVEAIEQASASATVSQ